MQELHRRNHLNAVQQPPILVKRNDNQSGLGIVFGKCLEAMRVSGLDLASRFELYGHTAITNDCIYLISARCAPVAQMIITPIVTQKGDNLLNHQVLKGMTEVIAARLQRFAASQVVCDPDCARDVHTRHCEANHRTGNQRTVVTARSFCPLDAHPTRIRCHCIDCQAKSVFCT